MLVVMPFRVTPDNNRWPVMQQALDRLLSLSWGGAHRLVLVNDASSVPFGQTSWERALALGSHRGVSLIEIPKRAGTARAVNAGWSMRAPGEVCCKIDDDVIVHGTDWREAFEDALARDPTVGILAGKRNDLLESPRNPPGQWSHSELEMMPHEPGQRWRVIELVTHAMGNLHCVQPALLDKIGYLAQFGYYGMDDALYCHRAWLAGFRVAFLCGIDIDHIDPGATPYTDWKCSYAGEHIAKYYVMREMYEKGTRPLFENADTDLNTVM